MLSQVIFGVVLVGAVALFVYHIRLLSRTLKIGRPYALEGPRGAHWMQMLRVAVFQQRMMDRPIASAAHWVIYVGFLVINVEVLEIVIDGLTGSHRALAPLLGSAYNLMTVSAEVFLALVFVAAVIFLWRRNIQKLPRFHTAEMRGWPPLDANIILWTEIVLVSALLIMNAADFILQARGVPPYVQAGAFPVSSFLRPLFEGFSDNTLIAVERAAWWVHILGILAFLNYIPFSKHLHIFPVFPQYVLCPAGGTRQNPLQSRPHPHYQRSAGPSPGKRHRSA
jgi:hypothetical protein